MQLSVKEAIIEVLFQMQNVIIITHYTWLHWCEAIKTYCNCNFHLKMNGGLTIIPHLNKTVTKCIKTYRYKNRLEKDMFQ